MWVLVDKNVVSDLVAERVGPSPKHVVDGNAPRVSNDAWRRRVAKQGLQAANVKIKKTLGSVIDLVTGRVAEKVRPVRINKALPCGPAEASVESGAPVVGYVARAGDRPVDRHTRGKLMMTPNFLVPPSASRVFQSRCGPYGSRKATLFVFLPFNRGTNS